MTIGKEASGQELGRKGANMNQQKIDRINELARKAKTTSLTEEECAEQAALRREYIEEFRGGFQSILDNTVLQRPDGTKEPLKKSDGKNGS